MNVPDPKESSLPIACPLCGLEDFDTIFIGPSDIMIGCDGCVATLDRTEINL